MLYFACICRKCSWRGGPDRSIWAQLSTGFSLKLFRTNFMNVAGGVIAVVCRHKWQKLFAVNLRAINWSLSLFWVWFNLFALEGMDDLDCTWHLIFILCLLVSEHLIKNVAGYILSYSKILSKWWSYGLFKKPLSIALYFDFAVLLSL